VQVLGFLGSLGKTDDDDDDAAASSSSDTGKIIPPADDDSSADDEGGGGSGKSVHGVSSGVTIILQSYWNRGRQRQSGPQKLGLFQGSSARDFITGGLWVKTVPTRCHKGRILGEHCRTAATSN